MTHAAMRRQQGLTLIELLLGLAITALVLAPLVPMVATATNAARINGDQAALEQEASFALARIGARIRATAPPIQMPPLKDDWLKPAVYVRNGTTLIEQQGSASYVVAESVVTDLQLEAPANTGGQQLIQVTLNLARGDARLTASATVRMGSQR